MYPWPDPTQMIDLLPKQVKVKYFLMSRSTWSELTDGRNWALWRNFVQIGPGSMGKRESKISKCDVAT